MTLVRVESVSLEYGEQPLLKDANLVIEANERVCLIGRNGAGKTSLFGLLTGAREPDRGLIERKPDLVISTVDQGLPTDLAISVFEAVAEGLASVRGLADEYERRAMRPLDKSGLRELELLQRHIEIHGGWEGRAACANNPYRTGFAGGANSWRALRWLAAPGFARQGAGERSRSAAVG